MKKKLLCYEKCLMIIKSCYIRKLSKCSMKNKSYCIMKTLMEMELLFPERKSDGRKLLLQKKELLY